MIGNTSSHFHAKSGALQYNEPRIVLDRSIHPRLYDKKICEGHLIAATLVFTIREIIASEWEYQVSHFLLVMDCIIISLG